jgi:hypothetical protein
MRRAALPGGDDAAGAADDWQERQHVIGLELGLDHEVDVARRQHAIGVAVAAVARQPRGLLDPAENRAVVRFHQQRAGGEQHRLGELGADAHAQIARPGRAAIRRPPAVATEALADEGLVHHAEHRLARA